MPPIRTKIKKTEPSTSSRLVANSPSSPSSGPKRKATLSCVNCRTKKIKCDVNVNYPCSSCITKNIDCIKSTVDKRKDRPTSKSIEQLEKKLKSYETVFRFLKKLNSRSLNVLSLVEGGDLDDLNLNSNGKNNKIMQDLSINDDDLNLIKSNILFSSDSSSSSPLNDIINGNISMANRNSIHNNENETPLYSGSLSTNLNEKYPKPKTFSYENKAISVYGPTSIFDTVTVPITSTSKEYVKEISEFNSDPAIIECIQMFFQWLYPDIHTFMFREPFLVDFFHPKPSKSYYSYCSKELVFAICALGSLFSSDPEIYSKSIKFYQKGRELLLSKLNEPSITALQSFLLLGLYDIYNGRNNCGWMLSGNAIRMGFNLGFQLNPKSWYLNTKSKELTEMDIGIRSRIFWGTYVADHFIGLILGRPSLLKMTDSTIQESIRMPDIDWIDEYSYPGLNGKPEVIDVSNPLKSIVKLISITEGMLQEVFIQNTAYDSKKINGGINKRANNSSGGTINGIFNANTNTESSKTNKLNHSINSTQKLLLMKKLELLKKYNNKIIEWRENLPDILKWDQNTLLLTGNDPTKMSLRYYYYMVLLCLNRPFIEVSRKNKEDEELLNDSFNICLDTIEDLYISINAFVKNHGFNKCSVLIVYSSILSISVILLSCGQIDILDYLKKNKTIEKIFYGLMNVLKHCSKIWKLSEKSFIMIKTKLIKDFKFDLNKNLNDFIKTLDHFEFDNLIFKTDDNPTNNNLYSENDKFGNINPYNKTQIANNLETGDRINNDNNNTSYTDVSENNQNPSYPTSTTIRIASIMSPIDEGPSEDSNPNNILTKNMNQPHFVGSPNTNSLDALAVAAANLSDKKTVANGVEIQNKPVKRNLSNINLNDDKPNHNLEISSSGDLLDYKMKDESSVNSTSNSRFISTAALNSKGIGRDSVGDEEPENVESPSRLLLNDHDLQQNGFGGPPLFMNSEMFGDWEFLFPDYVFDSMGTSE
ncbi:hypothetical protein B5S29_g594 [[Candida] boidinii]|uniref:Unnamed protein product n=1 Tax=Candida boidinii TaxID=5477 RepID=A0ACB5TE83_CANBO|nr:hypothetical protein B5S29_g594 [[Candida] boidinii]GME86801.1 unnamed protein product [[Candida] boidinii]